MGEAGRLDNGGPLTRKRLADQYVSFRKEKDGSERANASRIVFSYRIG